MAARPADGSTAPLLRVIAVAALVAVGVGAAAAYSLFGRSSPAPAGAVGQAPPGPATPGAAPGGGGAGPESRAALALALSTPPSLRGAADAAPPPRWIWASPQAGPGQRAWFRAVVDAGPAPARGLIRFACDNHAVVRADGVEVARADDWQRPVTAELPVRPGANAIEIEARNDGGPAALAAVIEIVDGAGGRRHVATGPGWTAADDGGFVSPRPAVDLGPLGVAPWGALPAISGGDLDRSIRVRAGFDVEPVYVVPPEQGSWVSLTADGAGRLIAGAEGGGLYRITPPADGRAALVEPIDVSDGTAGRLGGGGAHGLACVGGDLYCVINGGGDGVQGLHRLRDTDGDGRYDQDVLLRAISGDGGEHGPHGVVPGPDGMLYIVCGNHVAPPAPERSAVPRNWGEDLLLERLWDPLGHAVGVMAPGGWIARTDPDGRTWELLAIGMRNPYDIAFDHQGELFTFDADMEWDMGTPWYRPTRVLHVTSGAEFGWRSGSGKWPAHWPDSLPAVIDMGPGSPTGIVFGTRSTFPGRYRDALFLLDWTFGTIHALHLHPRGASFEAEVETFLTGHPLPVTDADVNPADGAMYFAVGGRGAASAVYRVRWVGEEGEAPAPRAATGDGAARHRRLALEAWHGPDEALPGGPADLEIIWAGLGDGDRHVRYAARVALEHRPVERWALRAAAEPRARVRLAALTALARASGAARRATIIEGLWPLRWQDLDEPERRELLRAWVLCFLRTGPPDTRLAWALAERLEAVYPCGDELADRDLCDLLVFLGSSAVVPRTIALMERPDSAPQAEPDEAMLARGGSFGQQILKMAAAPPQRQQVHYALALRRAKAGWTPELRERYFRWFDAARRSAGGMSFAGYLDAIRADALEALPPAVRDRFETHAALPAPPDAALRPRGPGRPWLAEEIVELARADLHGRRFERGKELFEGASCAACHRLAGQGAAGGPDLSGAGSRFSLRDLAVAIVEPGRVVSDQYALTELLVDDGSVLLGRVVGEDAQSVRIVASMLAPGAVEAVPAPRIVGRRRSAVSPMMPGLLDELAPGEVLDLVAYLLAGGDPRADVFSPEEEFRPLFDGRTLAGFSGEPGRWSVEDGAIVGRVEPQRPLAANTYLVLDDPLPRDFELVLEARLAGDGNSGIQYRSRRGEGFGVAGPQCDIHPHPAYHGMLYEEGGRGIVAEQGRRLRLEPGGGATPLAPPAAPISFAPQAWHEYAVIARGNRLEHRVDGTVTCVVIDDAPPEARPHGDRMALQLHAGPAYEVRFRRIRLRSLDGSSPDR